MPGEEVIELSIEETNKLRLELGLKPLRGVTSSSYSLSGNTAATTNSPPLEQNHNSTSKNSDEINLSIEETNNLRSKLGLPPLKLSSSQNNSGKKASEAIHAPALNTRKQDEIQKRIEEAKLKREVEAGLAKMQKDALSHSEKEEGGSMISWAEKMRHGNNSTSDTTSTTKTVKMEKKVKTKSRHDGNKRIANSANTGYTNNDFNNQNITVAHSTQDFEAGTTTILTLADKNILGANDEDENNDDDNQLVNINMIENATVANNLKQKRILEMGIGHAGGYAGYDDDEFEEMGGIGGFATNNGGSGGNNHKNNSEAAKKNRKGFKLMDTISNSDQDENKKEAKSELFNSFQGKSISLVSSKQNPIQCDYMTYDEEEAISNTIVNRADLEKKRKKKEKKMLKKLRKRGKAETKEKGYNEENSKDNKDGQSLLDDLESNASAAKNGKNNQRSRKRRRVTDDDDSDEDICNLSSKVNVNDKNHVKSEDDDLDIQTVRKEKFDSIMQKGNIRTENIFKNQSHSMSQEEVERDDDDFLSVALSKARRLRRLKELNAKENQIKSNTDGGADAVVKSISSMRNSMNIEKESKKNSTITFELDATKEFTRMLRSQKTEDIDESIKDSQRHAKIDMTSSNNDLIETAPLAKHVTNESESNPPESLEALADQVEEDQPDSLGGFGDTASTLPLGRGMASCLSMLKHTGEITGKNAGKEELRGRAKDERNYEDYEKLNLKEVVKLDTSLGRVHEKDMEFANREVKLEYRDKHGRLLTRKEAWRDLSYQFHGYGSSKKNEERRLRQIERERAEATRASKHGGTFGALKATQSATGKAFVLHKT